jgi:hypothetical protein
VASSGEKKKKLDYASILGREPCLGFLLGSCQCFKNIGDGPINVAPSEREKKKAGVDPFLINRSTNKYPSLCAIVVGLATS